MVFVVKNIVRYMFGNLPRVILRPRTICQAL